MPSAKTLDNLYNNAALLLDASVQQKSDKLSAPENIVANWKCTRLYPAVSWRGRLWRLIGWMTGLRSVFLHATIQRTVIAFKNHLDARERELEKIEAPGYLGTWWKNKNFKQMLARAQAYHRGCVAIAGRQENISKVDSIVRWAFYHHQGDIPLQETFQTVCSPQNIERACRLEDKLSELAIFKQWWDQMELGCSIETLYRELVFHYPKTDDAAAQYAYSLVDDGEPCSEPDIIYGPILHLAATVAYSDGVPLKKLEEELAELLRDVKKHNLELLLKLVYHLREPKKRMDLSKIPPGALRLIEKGRLSACTFHGATGQKVYSWGDPHSVRRLRGSDESFLSSLARGRFRFVEEAVRPKFYQFPQYIKFQDGTGKIITTKKCVGEF